MGILNITESITDGPNFSKNIESDLGRVSYVVMIFIEKSLFLDIEVN